MVSTTFILGAVIFGVVNLSMASPVAKQILWHANEAGTGSVPMYLGESFSFDDEVDANPNNINFWLHTKFTEKRQEIENKTASIDGSKWDKDAPVKIFAHGFTGNSYSGPSTQIKNAYINDEYPTNVNLIIIDWSILAAAPWYDVAALGTKTVGLKTAHLLDFLVRNGYTTVDKIHISGHSLGSHVAGYIGAHFFEINGAKIPRISALDPALPRFGDAPDANRIDPTDAAHVEVIHTNAGPLLTGDLGFREPRGHIDFYPNKGASQPGCGGSFELISICSHMRVATIFAESIQSQGFRAIKCNDDNYKGKDQFTTCDAAKGEAVMGEWGQPGPSGIFYLTTKGKSLFAEW